MNAIAKPFDPALEPTPFQQNGILFQIRQKYGVVADSDSYKLSHHPQYVAGATRMASYIESRGGKYDKIVFFGLRFILKEYFLQRLTHAQVDNIIAWEKEHFFGNCTDDLEKALRVVVDEYQGRMPIKITAAREGMVIPTKNVLVVVESVVDDNRIFSLVSYFETKILRLWSPTTIATTSWHLKKVIYSYLQQTADNPDAEIPFKLHDFGSRGGSSMETVAFGGAGHLISFSGSDTTVAVMAIEIAFNERMAANSIPASEHSSTTSHTFAGEGELGLIKAMFDKYAVPGGLFATVIDSYDALNFIRTYGPMFKERLIASGATWVFRPDSGDSVEMPIKTVIELEKIFGTTVNTKGFKVLNNVRVIQGDGIGPEEVGQILQRLVDLGYCTSNMAFGMGGGLLQKNDRDTQKFSMKCCAIYVDGQWYDVYKNPAVYDENWNVVNEVSFKLSKKGRPMLVQNINTLEYKTVRVEEVASLGSDWVEAMEEVYNTGYITSDVTFSEIKANSNLPLAA